MTPKHTLVRGLAAAALLLIGTLANAAVITDTASYSAQGSPQLLELDRFDGTLGTLNSVTFTVSGALDVSSTVHNSSAALNLTNVQIVLFGSVIGSLTAGGPSALSDPLALVPLDTFIGARTFTILNPLASTSTGVFHIGVSPAAQTFSGAAAQSFIGSGTFGYTFVTDGAATRPVNFASVQLGPAAQSSLSLAVSYDYTPAAPVPVPGGPGLALSGLAVVAWMARRQRR